MTSCDTAASPFTAVGSGPVCNGHGTCVAGACVCEEGWTGASDFFTLEGVGCHNPVVLDRLLWAVAAVVWFTLWVDSFKAVRHHYGKWASTAKASDRLLSWATLRTSTHLFIILPMCFPTLPLVLACLILRAASPQHFAVDSAVSYLYAVGFGMQWALSMPAQHLMLVSLIRGAMKFRGAELARIVARDRNALAVATSLYVAVLAGTCVAGVYLPVGEVNTGRVVITAVRNMGMVAWFIFNFVHNAHIQQEVKATMESLANAQRHVSPQHRQQNSTGSGSTSNGVNGGNDPLKRALNHLGSVVRAQKLIMTVVGPLLVVFTAVPQLYGYSYVVMAFLITLGAGKNHTLRAWTPASTKSKSASKSSDVDPNVHGVVSPLSHSAAAGGVSSPSAFTKQNSATGGTGTVDTAGAQSFSSFAG